jgi:hypothetical protein
LGYAIAGYYAIGAWSQVLVWPASQAPYCERREPGLKFTFRKRMRELKLIVFADKYAWQVSIALWILVIIMTSVLRYVDVRYLM